MTKEELARRILLDLHESFNNENANLFNRITGTIDFYLQCELHSLREQEFDLDAEQVLALIEQAQMLGELRGMLESELKSGD